MAQLFLMPQPGSTMEEGTILKWHKQEGDTVAKGEILLEVETDKASVEIEAETDGVVRKILAAENETVPVKQPIAILGTAEEPIDALLAQAGLAVAPGVANPAPSAPATAAPTAARAVTVTAPSVGATVNGGRVFLSPRARRVADEHGIPAAALAGRGTGVEGRVVERDVLAYLETQQAESVTEAVRPAPRATPLAARIADDLGINLGDLTTGLPGSRVRSEDVLRHAESNRPPVEAVSAPVAAASSPSEGTTVLPLVGMRKRIADNIVKSAFSAPHVTLTIEVDMTAATEFRARLLPEIEKAYGTRVTYTDILVKAVARALGEHPLLNAALVGNEIHLYTQKNIGVAVALDEGLVVPVLKEADKKSLGAVSAELKQMVERCRAGKFSPEDLSGGTFSITNLGAFGIEVFDPVIVPPQAAILGVCRIAEKPVVVNKEVVIRSMMNLCLSFDHRVLDGAPASRFLQRLKELLENPLLILV